jgi:hypothetical protein
MNQTQLPSTNEAKPKPQMPRPLSQMRTAPQPRPITQSKPIPQARHIPSGQSATKTTL